MKNILVKTTHIFLLTLIVIFYCKILSPLSEIPLIFSDTLSEVFTTFTESGTFFDRIRYLFSSNPHNFYILSMLHVLFGNYLPQIFNIHPMEFAKTYYFYIYLIIFMSLISTNIMNFSKYFKQKKYFYLLLPFLLFFFIKANKDAYCLWFFAQAGFMYSYYLSPIFAMLLLQKTEYSYIKKQILPKYNFGIIFCFCIFVAFANLNLPTWVYFILLFTIPDLIRKKLFISSKKALGLSILIIAVSVCNEFYRFIFLSSIIIGFILHKLLINKEVKIGKFLSYFSLICFSMIVNTFSKDYFSFAESRTRTISDLLLNVGNYCNDFVTALFTDNILLFAVLITLVICSFTFVKNSERNKRFFIFNFSVFLSAILFFVLTFPCNYNNHSSAEMSVLNYGPLILAYKFTLYYIVFSYAGYIIAFSEQKKHSIQTIILTVLYVISSSNYKPDFTFEQGHFKSLKRKLYIFERLFIEDTRYTKLGYSNYEEFNPPYYTLYYYICNYAPKTKKEDYKLIEVCGNAENDLTCDNKIKAIIKEKTGYVFSEKELKELDFSIYDKYRTKY